MWTSRILNGLWIDAGHCKAHPHAAGAKGGNQDMSRTKWKSGHNGIWLPPEEFERKIKKGIIYPQYYAPVMVGEQNHVEAAVMQWGLKRSWTSGVIDNLRSDKLAEKHTFDKIKNSRCVVPCGGFYEYQKNGIQVIGDYLFANEDNRTLYLAGLYEQNGDRKQYSIVTTDSNTSVDIHDRMPVVLRKEECRAWLSGNISLQEVNKPSGVFLRKIAV